MNVKWVKAVSLSAMLAAFAYLVVVAWAGRTAVGIALGHVGIETLFVVLSLSLTNYGLRFVRWHYFLRKVGSDIGVLANLRIYIGGFALTTTPGKAGELARTVWLRPYGVPANRSVAAFLAERIQDFIVILMLSCFGLPLLVSGRWLLPVGFVLLLAIMLLLFMPGPIRIGMRRAAWGNGRVANFILKTAEILTHLRDCLTPGPLCVGLGLGLVAWSAESWSFAILMQALGHPIPLITAFSIYAFSMLAGALSFMPGGLGSCEATMIVLLRVGGVPLSDAVSATVLIRLVTLWFAVLLGFLALAIRTKIPEPSMSSTVAEGSG